MRILLVEDDPKIAGFVRMGLEQAGYAMDHACNGEDGLQRVAPTASHSVARSTRAQPMWWRPKKSQDQVVFQRELHQINSSRAGATRATRRDRETSQAVIPKGQKSSARSAETTARPDRTQAHRCGRSRAKRPGRPGIASMTRKAQYGRRGHRPAVCQTSRRSPSPGRAGSTPGRRPRPGELKAGLARWVYQSPGENREPPRRRAKLRSHPEHQADPGRSTVCLVRGFHGRRYPLLSPRSYLVAPG